MLRSCCNRCAVQCAKGSLRSVPRAHCAVFIIRRAMCNSPSFEVCGLLYHVVFLCNDLFVSDVCWGIPYEAERIMQSAPMKLNLTNIQQQHDPLLLGRGAAS